MRKLVLATRNAGKERELKLLLAGLPLEIASLRDYPEIPELVEDGDTFAANAAAKARQVAAFTGEMALADDSGLEVDALGGRPGVHSARFAGPGASDADRNAKLLEMLTGV
ncbi:MAG: non-canonical purine NTP pyrophosphatase, partial [Bacillota bacterium]